VTKAELAAQIKAKYPAYAGVPDDELVAKIIAKYPVYQSRLTDGPGPATAAPSPTPKPIIEAMDPAGGEPDPAGKPGLFGGFLQTTPLNPRNLYEMAKGVYKPTAAAGMQVLQDTAQGNFLKAGAGALDLVQGGPAARTVTDPMMQHLVGVGKAIEQGDALKAAEQATGVIPGNAGMLALGQENAGNYPALAGNLLGIGSGPKLMKGSARVLGAGVDAAGTAAKAAKASSVGQRAASVLDRFNTTARKSVNQEYLDQASSTAVTAGAITLNPLVGLAAGALELAKKVIPEFVERWRNNGAAKQEILTATKEMEKAAANKIKYRGVSKDEFAQVQDHLEALKIEADNAAKATQAAVADSQKAAKAEVTLVETAEKRTAQQIATAEKTAAKATAQGAKIDAELPLEQAKDLAAKAKTAISEQKAREGASIQSGGIEARILEASQKVEAAAKAETAAAQVKLEKASTTEKARAQRDLEIAQSKEATARRRVEEAAKREEAAQIRREFRQRTQLDKQAAAEAAKAQKAKAPKADQPPTVTVPGETAPKVVSPATPDPLTKARKSATAIVYGEDRATGKPYDIAKVEAGVKKSYPNLTPEEVSRVAKETVADAMHIETVAGGLASKGQGITQINAYLRRVYPDMPTRQIVQISVREVKAMGDAMTPAQRQDLKLVNAAPNIRKLGLDLKPRTD